MAGGSYSSGPLGGALTHLGDVEVDAEALPLPLHLPHTEPAGQLARAQADPLQREGAVQAPLRAAPDVIKRDFLKRDNQSQDRHTN